MGIEQNIKNFYDFLLYKDSIINILDDIINQLNKREINNLTPIAKKSETTTPIESSQKKETDFILQPQLNYNYDERFDIQQNLQLNIQEKKNDHSPFRNSQSFFEKDEIEEDEEKPSNKEDSAMKDTHIDQEKEDKEILGQISNLTSEKPFTPHITIQQDMNDKNHSHSQSFNREKGKPSRIADIMMKLTSNDMIHDIIIQIYGENIFNELMSADAEIDLIESVEKSIKEIEILEKKENEKTLKPVEDNQNKYQEHKQNIPTPYQTALMSSFNYLQKQNNQSIKKSNRHNHEKNFELDSSLHSPKTVSKTKLIKMNSFLLKKYPQTSKNFLKTSSGIDYSEFKKSLRKSIEKNYQQRGRTFVNYTSPVSGYFDASLQKGGESQLYIQEKIKATKKSKNSGYSPIARCLNTRNYSSNNYYPYNI